MPRSFRSRLLWGALLGAVGILPVIHLLSLHLYLRYPIILHIAHSTLLLIFAALFILIGFLQVRKGLSPFDQLRARLTAVRDGKIQKIDGNYPAEVQPLVNDLNALLDHREQVVKRAQAKAGDLAHGLKTPLAVLSQEAERAKAAGQTELAATILQQVERMRRQVEYQLAHARAAGSGASPGTQSRVGESVDGLIRTLQRLYAERGITIRSEVRAEHTVRVQREDLDEMLGNLLDNACKWGKSQVVVSANPENGRLAITIDDDGPGLDPAKRELVLRRGVRADEAAPGSGLGLAIVRDLAELYGGSITLDNSPLNGLRATLRLPV
jgi:signal transduction histidine kinase